MYMFFLFVLCSHRSTSKSNARQNGNTTELSQRKTKYLLPWSRGKILRSSPTITAGDVATYPRIHWLISALCYVSYNTWLQRCLSMSCSARYHNILEGMRTDIKFVRMCRTKELLIYILCHLFCYCKDNRLHWLSDNYLYIFFISIFCLLKHCCVLFYIMTLSFLKWY